MSYPKYFVSYCTMSEAAGANPFWHAFLLMSKQEEENGPTEIVDTFGFYSTESTTTHPIIKSLKNLLGLKFNLQDGHGLLQKEELRHLDIGGIEGISYPVERQAFEAIQRDLITTLAMQKEATDEISADLRRQGVPSNCVSILLEEESRSAEQHRETRLKKFHITGALKHNGLDTSASYTCKHYAIDVLLKHNIIKDEERATIIGKNSTAAFPRVSGGLLLPLRMVSVPKENKQIIYRPSSSSGRYFKDRSWENSKLYLTLPVDPLNDKAAIAHYRERSKWIQNTLEKAQSLELELGRQIAYFNHSDPVKEAALKEQVHKIQSVYRMFSNASRNKNDRYLINSLHKTEKIFNVAYLTLNDRLLNASLAFRFYSSVMVKQALFALCLLAYSCAALSGVGASILITASSLYAGHKLYGFYKSEVKLAQMRADHHDVNRLHKSPSLGFVGEAKMRSVQSTFQMDDRGRADSPQSSPLMLAGV